MTTRLVKPLDRVDDAYDLVVAALGYEKRARFTCETRAPRASLKACCGFVTDHTLSFDENEKWFTQHGFRTAIKGDDDYSEWFALLLDEVINGAQAPVRVLIDISSQSRLRLAMLIDVICTKSHNVPLTVDFSYAVARFTPPPIEASVIATAGPVLERFAGWAVEPELPTSVIVGAGYEPDKVLGVLEYLEAGDVWVWVPKGNDARFLSAVQQSNEGIWETTSSDNHISYDVLSPFDTFVRLESLCYGLIRKSRPVLVPFGPKVFALASMLVALHWPNELSIWRVSGEEADVPVDREADGTIVGLRLELGPQTPTSNI